MLAFRDCAFNAIKLQLSMKKELTDNLALSSVVVVAGDSSGDDFLDEKIFVFFLLVALRDFCTAFLSKKMNSLCVYL